MSLSNQTVNGVPLSAILQPYVDDPSGIERIAQRKVPAPALAIEEPNNASWDQHFQTLRSRILSAFDQTSPIDEGGQAPTPSDASAVSVLSLNHVGSTSVPDLPAKAVIDIDLVLSSNTLSHEPFYVPRLESAGFQYLLREPSWHDHRFFCASEPMSCNLHVWGPRCAEVERHRIFRDWLRENEGERELYARTKRECAEAANRGGEGMGEYTNRKDQVVREILGRAYRGLGYVSK
jgi:GrpB-like predicted nucleotidyltransferase (UPF0157 family)